MYHNTNSSRTYPVDEVMYAINIFYGINMVFGFGANLITIVTIVRTKSLRTPMNVALVSLSVVDLGVSTLVIPVRLTLYNTHINLSDIQLLILCKTDMVIKCVCDYAQPFMLVATSYERYKSIAKPLHSKGELRPVAVFVTVTWLVSVVLGTLTVVGFRDGVTRYPCNYINVNADTMFNSTYREGALTLPFGVFCIMCVLLFYIMMIRVLHKHTTDMSKSNKIFKNKVRPSNSFQIKNSKSKPLELHSELNEMQEFPSKQPTLSTTEYPDHSNMTDVQEEIHVTTNCEPDKSQESPVNSSSTKLGEYSSNNGFCKLSIHETRNVLLKRQSSKKFSSLAKQIVSYKRQRSSLSNYRVAPDIKIVGPTFIQLNDAKCDTSEDQTLEPSALSKQTNDTRPCDRLINGQYLLQENACNPIMEKTNKVDGFANTVSLDSNFDNKHRVQAQASCVTDDISQEHYHNLNTTNAEKDNSIPPTTIGSHQESVNGRQKQTSRDRLRKINHFHNKNANINQTFDNSVATENQWPDSCRKRSTSLPDEKVQYVHCKLQLTANRWKTFKRTNRNNICNHLQSSKSGDKCVNPQTHEINRDMDLPTASVEQLCATGIASNSNSCLQIPNFDLKPHSHMENAYQKIGGQPVSSAQSVGIDRNVSDGLHPQLTLGSKNAATGINVKENVYAQTHTQPRSKAPKSVSVDVVDFDGTVHKDVLVRGAVVGAVCVMNTSNRVAGRRKVELRAAKRVAILIGSFVCLWLPLPLSTLILSPTNDFTSSEINTLLITGAISCLTVTVNPLLSLALNRQLRSASATQIRKGCAAMKRTLWR